MTDRTPSTIEAVLEHYVTKTIGVVIAVFTVFKMIILPINEIQVGLVQVQKEVASLSVSSQQISANQRDIDVLKEQVSNLKDQLKNK